MENNVKQEKKEELSVTPEQSKRDFIVKMVTVAGAAALSGMLSGAQDANAETLKGPNVASFKHTKQNNGFLIVISGEKVGDTLKEMGVISDSSDSSKGIIKIEFSA